MYISNSCRRMPGDHAIQPLRAATSRGDVHFRHRPAVKSKGGSDSGGGTPAGYSTFMQWGQVVEAVLSRDTIARFYQASYHLNQLRTLQGHVLFSTESGTMVGDGDSTVLVLDFEWEEGGVGGHAHVVLVFVFRQKEQ